LFLFIFFRFLPDRQSGENVQDIKRKVFGLDPDEDKPVFRKKKIKGPNPLSCKKKQKKSQKQPQQPENSKKPDTVSDGKVAKKRARKRVKVAQHVKELLKTKASSSS